MRNLMKGAGPQLQAALKRLEYWLDDEKIRAIDWQIAKETVQWERQCGTRDDELLALLAMAACAVSVALGRGQVCLPLTQWVLPDAGMTLRDSEAQLLQCRVIAPAPECESLTRECPPLMILHNGRLYLHRYFDYEQQVLREIRQRTALTDEAAPALAQTLTELFPGDRAGSPDWQAIAAATACLQPLCVITGGPGTGKTTTVTRLLSVLLSADPHLRIALAAPTGKAAARMTESIRQAREKGGLPHAEGIPSESFTLHRLLGWSPRGFRYHRQRCLPYDCVVVDEASMIDLPMMSHLLSALAPQARLILLGDRDQLASVEAGSVLADLCDAGTVHGPAPEFAQRLAALTGYDLSDYTEPGGALMQNAVVQLRVSHRFRSDSGIGELARAVNRGDAAASRQAFDQYGDIDWLDAGSSDWARYVVDGYRQYCELIRNGGAPEWVLEAFDRFRVLVALRNGIWGVEETNRQIERLLTRAGLLTDTAQHWYSGRPVMITRNDYDLGLFNGDIGVLLRRDGQDRVVFRDADGGLRYLSPGRLPAHETAFAMTVHKSQGSEFNEVVLLLPPAWQQVITRELIYTAITRAKQTFRCQAADACWQQGLSTRTERASGLRDELWNENT